MIIYQSPPSLDLFDIFQISKGTMGTILYTNLKYSNKNKHIEFVKKLNNQNIKILGLLTYVLKGDKYYEQIDIEKNSYYKFLKFLFRNKKIEIINRLYRWVNS